MSNSIQVDYPTAEQQEELLLRSGWTHWTDELNDGRKVKLPTFKYEGDKQWYYNELHQAEYANEQRKYTQQEALRIHRLLNETEIILRARKAEAERRGGITTESFAPKQPGVSAAEAAAREAEAAEAQAATA